MTTRLPYPLCLSVLLGCAMLTGLSACSSTPKQGVIQSGNTAMTPAQQAQAQWAELNAELAQHGMAAVLMQDLSIRVSVPSDISFLSGSSEVTERFVPVLEKVSISMQHYPNTRMELVGHTDSTGSDAINQPLSLARADATKLMLVRLQVAHERLTIKGMGAKEPVADNATEAGRAKNRRVDLYILHTSR